MLTTKLRPRDPHDTSWAWAVQNGRRFRVAAPGGKPFFDVLLLGQADYVAVNVNPHGEYDPTAPLKLFSVNGEFRHWVEKGLKGPIRGVRWAVEYDTYEDRHHKPHWRILGDNLAPLAVEQVMGELVNDKGEVVGP